MKILLSVDGFEKIFDIQPSQYNRGFVDVGVIPPMKAIAHMSDIKLDSKPCVLRFFKTGTEKGGYPIFKYRMQKERKDAER